MTINDQDLIGKRVIDDRHELSDSKAPNARQSNASTEVRLSELPETTRVLYRDTIVTYDLVKDRLNLHVNKDSKIVQVTRG